MNFMTLNTSGWFCASSPCRCLHSDLVMSPRYICSKPLEAPLQEEHKELISPQGEPGKTPKETETAIPGVWWEAVIRVQAYCAENRLKLENNLESMIRSACSHLFAAFLHHLTSACLAAEGTPSTPHRVELQFQAQCQCLQKDRVGGATLATVICCHLLG